MFITHHISGGFNRAKTKDIQIAQLRKEQISNGYYPCLAGAPFDLLSLAILLNLLVVVAHSADMPQLLLPWLPYGNHSWKKRNPWTSRIFGRKISHIWQHFSWTSDSFFYNYAGYISLMIAFWTVLSGPMGDPFGNARLPASLALFVFMLCVIRLFYWCCLLFSNWDVCESVWMSVYLLWFFILTSLLLTMELMHYRCVKQWKLRRSKVQKVKIYSMLIF